MNKVRRKKLQKVVDLIAEARELMDEVREEEEAAYDNLPESLQGGERGQEMEECFSSLEEFVSSLEDIETTIEDMI